MDTDLADTELFHFSNDTWPSDRDIVVASQIDNITITEKIFVCKG